ncbi:MAG TPA: TetR/AcrR family transcriptional regulator [Pseudonocardia sp.]|nr:TetR/AcrR family transcriptional regulator [Pseudonocardia sp.]
MATPTSRPPEPVSRRARPAKPPLTRAGIVMAAIRVLDAEGLDGVTMRKLAQELDTAAGSLYVYFANRDELLASVYDEVLAELPLPARDRPAAEWRADLTDLLLTAITVIGGHGGIARVALGAIPTGPHALALAEAILALLARGGVGAQAASWAVDQLTLYVNAAALEESTYRQRGAREQAVLASLRTTYAQLPPERYPNIHRLREELVTGSGDDRARWFLDTVLAGIAIP